MKSSAEHLFHDVSAMPDPIPGTVGLISTVLGVILLVILCFKFLINYHMV